MEEVPVIFYYINPKMVALIGISTASCSYTLAGPRHRLDDVPSLSSCHRPPGRGTVRLVSVGL